MLPVASTALCVWLFQHPQLPSKTPQLPSNRGHKAAIRGTFGAAGSLFCFGASCQPRIAFNVGLIIIEDRQFRASSFLPAWCLHASACQVDSGAEGVDREVPEWVKAHADVASAVNNCETMDDDGTHEANPLLRQVANLSMLLTFSLELLFKCIQSAVCSVLLSNARTAARRRIHEAASPRCHLSVEDLFGLFAAWLKNGMVRNA